MIFAKSKQISKRSILIALVVIGVAAYLGLQNYLLFHSLVELVSIIIAFNIFIIAFNTRDIADNNFFIFLGLAYFFVGSFDLLHTLAYKGLDIFAHPGANLATQLWIIARYIESCSLLIAFKYSDTDIKFDKIMAIYSFLTVVLLLMVFQYQSFPACFVAGSGLTLFKIVSEYLISVILIGVCILLKMKKEDMSPKLYQFLKYSILASIGAELSFTLYSDVYGLLNMLGHIFKLISFYWIYKAIVETSFRQPYTNLFQELVSKNEKLEAERDKLDKYFEVSGVMIIGIDGNSKITEVNQKSCQVLGYSKQELCGKDWSYFLAREEVKRAKNVFADAPAGQSSLINYGQNEVITKSGAKRKIIWTSRVLKDEAGNIKRILSSGLDVTKSSLLKEKLEYNRLQVEFFANLSHELKTPLNLIFSALKVADSYQENNLAPEVYQDLNNYTEIIRDNSNRLLRLVNNLIDITKLDSNSFDLNLKNTDLVELLEGIIDSVRSYIETEDRILKFNSNLDKKVIACDPFNTERIILNLISNALKFTEIGDEIIVDLTSRGEQVLISVKDTGIGISEEEQEIIFDRFRQVDKSFNRSNEGSGIGLAIVKSLVELHDGEIELDSNYGEYTEFTIKLPDKQLKTANRSNQDPICANKDIIDRLDIEFSDLYNCN